MEIFLDPPNFMRKNWSHVESVLRQGLAGLWDRLRTKQRLFQVGIQEDCFEKAHWVGLLPGWRNTAVYCWESQVAEHMNKGFGTEHLVGIREWRVVWDESVWREESRGRHGGKSWIPQCWVRKMSLSHETKGKEACHSLGRSYAQEDYVAWFSGTYSP